MQTELRFNDRGISIKGHGYATGLMDLAREAARDGYPEEARRLYSDAADVYLRFGPLGSARSALEKAGRRREANRISEFLKTSMDGYLLNEMRMLERKVRKLPEKRQSKSPWIFSNWLQGASHSWSYFFGNQSDASGARISEHAASRASEAFIDAVTAQRAGKEDEARMHYSNAADAYLKEGLLVDMLNSLYKGGREEEARALKKRMLAQLADLERRKALSLTQRVQAMPDWSWQKDPIMRLVNGILRDRPVARGSAEPQEGAGRS